MIFDCIVLCGGSSLERQVSLSSGFAVAKALHSLSYKVAILDPAQGIQGLRTWPIDNLNFQSSRYSTDYRSHLDALQHVTRLKSFDRQKSIFFVALHGTWGEDGRVQALLDTLNCRYTGSDFAASSLAMNKAVSKSIVRNAEIQVSQGVEIDKKKISTLGDLNAIKQALQKLVEIDPTVKFVIVKPTCQGSSIATQCLAVDDHLQILTAVKHAQLSSHSALIEIFIEGREFTAAVLDDRALPLVEICNRRQFSDYDGKYMDHTTVYHCPVALTNPVENALKDAALKAHYSIGAKSFSRSDFRMNNRGEFFFLELNTLPGLTQKSLLPKAAAASGIDFNLLCQRILLSAH